MYASFLMKNKYSKVAGQFYYLISVMKVHFAARPITRNQHFRLVIVGYSVQNQHKNLLFWDKVPPINPFTFFDENNAIIICICHKILIL